jgi:hypothetical protein
MYCFFLVTNLCYDLTEKEKLPPTQGLRKWGVTCIVVVFAFLYSFVLGGQLVLLIAPSTQALGTLAAIVK